MYLIKRLIQIVGALTVLSVGLFYLLHAMPGDPTDQILMLNGSELSKQGLENARRAHFLDRPIHARYLCWLRGNSARACAQWPTKGVLSGDLGISQVYRRPVVEVLSKRLQASFILMIPAFLFALILSVFAGVWAAYRKGESFDRLVSALSLAGVAFPVHWLGLTCILVLGVSWRIFPVGGANDLRDPSFAGVVHHAAMPVGILTLFYFSRWVRHVRSQMLEVLQENYIKVARAKGLPEWRVLFVHGLRSGALPLLTVVGHSIPSVFAGAVVTERVFSYPGMGLLLLDSIKSDDYFLSITILLVFAAVSFICSLLIDLAYQGFDPRVRFEARP